MYAIYVYIYPHIRVWVYSKIYAYVHIFMFTYMHTHMHIYRCNIHIMYVPACICMYTCAHYMLMSLPHPMCIGWVSVCLYYVWIRAHKR